MSLSTGLQEILATVHALTQTEDPVETPFKSKYAARKVLTKAIIALTARAAEDEQVNRELEEALLHYHIGMNYASSEELSEGVKYLNKALPVLEQKEYSTVLVVELLTIYLRLAMIWSNREGYQKSLDLLVKGETLYTANKAQRQSTDATSAVTATTATTTDAQTAISLTGQTWADVEAAHTLTLYGMAQAHAQLKNSSESAKYCLVTLERQLQLKQVYDPADWFKNAVGLAVFFVEEGKLRSSMQCLLAAQSLLQEDAFPIVNKLDADPDYDYTPAEEQAGQLARGWGNFYTVWLRYSRLFTDQLNAVDGDMNQLSELGQILLNRCQETEGDLPDFTALDVKIAPVCALATTFETAVPIFKQGLEWFQQAVNMYVLDGFVSDNIPISQDMSQLHMHLIPFELDVSRKCKLHKRRLNLLEHYLEEINPKPYMELYQQLLDEIAGINSQMVHLKWELIYAAEEQKAPEKKLASMYNKANKLALQSITHYQLWRRTFSTPTPQNPKNDGLELPEDFDPEYHLVYLQATFQTARLFGKVFLTDPKQLCVFLQKSLECYELALSLATEWELSETTFKAESIICREMHELLPLKMTRIMNTGMCFHE